MAYILLLLIIFFVVVPIIRVMYKAWTIHRRMRRFMDDPFGQGDFGSGIFGQNPFGNTSRQRDTAPQQHVRSKKIPHDVGEYVAFTEYEGHTENSTTSSTGHVVTESQITDVEWVDIDK